MTTKTIVTLAPAAATYGLDRCYSGEVWRGPNDIFDVLIITGNGSLDNGATARRADCADDGSRIYLPSRPRSAGWVHVR
jgi:hypothetical protein